MTDEGWVFAEHEEQLAGLVGLRAHSRFRHAGGGGIRWTYKADDTMADVPTLGLDEALRIEEALQSMLDGLNKEQHIALHKDAAQIDAADAWHAAAALWKSFATLRKGRHYVISQIDLYS
jgi:hypothetical protein